VRGELQVLCGNADAVRLYEAAGWHRLPRELEPHPDGRQVAYGKDRLAS
jgi:hypothetical protein